MQKTDFFLRTKLLPPRPVSDLLSRPRLIQKLQANLGAPITLVTADAGCGKTTLVAEFIRQQSRQIVWYQLDYTDADPAVFLGYICHGIRRFAANFGEMILSYLNEATDDLLRFPERAVDLLLNEILETIEQPFILVLDDYHHIGRDTIVHRLVDRMLQYSSDIMHLIVTARDLPPLAITRRRSQAAALVLKREDLLFTETEVRDLFRQTLNVELKPEDVAEYREKTQGWVTALQLVKQVAEGQTYAAPVAPQIDLKRLLQLSEKDIFDYFAEEVFAGESGEMQQLLMRLALLEILTLDVCSQLFPCMHCAAALPALVGRNVFLTVASDDKGYEEYRLHPLFRDFLLRRLRVEIGRQEVAAERIRIAEFFVARQRFEQALSYLLEAEDFAKAAQIIAEHGDRWIASGAITILDSYAKQLPHEALESFPRSLVYAAEVARLQGDAERAITFLHRAAQLLHENRDSEGEAETLHSLASITRQRGDCEAAFEYLEKAEKLIGETSEVRMKCGNTRGLCLVAQNAWTNAERQFRLALELAEKLSNERYIRLISHNLALPAALRGDFGEALRWFKRMFREDQPDAQLPQEAIAHLNVARMHIYRGELTEAETHLAKALELGQLYNLKSLRSEIFESYGNFFREKRDFTHAAEFYERARKAYEDTGADLATKELDEERAQMALMQGDAASARELLESLLEKRRQKNVGEVALFVCRLSLCKVKLMLESEASQVITELEEILDYFHQHQHFYYEAQAALALARAYFLAEKRPEIQSQLQRALDIAARFDYDYWLRQEIKAHPAFFSDENVVERLPPDLRDQLAKVVVDKTTPEKTDKAEQKLILVTKPVVDLTLKLLGPVEIYRDPSKPFSADAWTTRRARDIFCYIAMGRYRRVEKDVLIDQFWGEADFDAIEKNFHPTISHIRKALNSRQTFKQNFLIYRDGAYQLNSELFYSIDTEEFDSFVAEAETAKRTGQKERVVECYQSAQKLYRGELMAGVYDDWVQQPRSYFSEKYQQILDTLAKAAYNEKDWAQTLKFTAEILRLDPYREDVHRLVMRVYAAQGKRQSVKEQFENLRQLLRKELGVDPEPETRRTFQELFK